MLSLGELQQRFLAAVTGGVAEGAPVAADPALLALVRRQGTLGAVERLQIYADMYRTRLLDALRDDFPRARAVVGDPVFDALAGRYLAHRPSTHPSVRHVGGGFADHLAGEAEAPPFLADLAGLEWARVEVFDAPDPEPLRLADLATVAPDDWAAFCLRPIAACRVVEASWPVHEIWAAAADENASPVDPRPAPTTLRVWREEWSVSHAAMGAVEVQAFRALQRGEPFGAICAAVDLPLEAAAREVGGVLLRWLEDGVLAR
jgi:hypothetical protein